MSENRTGLAATVQILSLCRIQQEPILEPEMSKKVAIRKAAMQEDLAHKGEASGGVRTSWTSSSKGNHDHEH